MIARFAQPLSLAALALLATSMLMPGCTQGNGGVGDGKPTHPQAAGNVLAMNRLPKPVRGVWVARFHYKTAEDVVRVIDQCARLGFNTVFWQVRGQGAVCYPSQIEPWAETYDFQSPGFDPLMLACDEAHRRGMRLEAWMNVMPGWKGPRAPAPPNQLWNAHPDWFLTDARGQRQPLGEFYVILNPALPEVRNHIVSVAQEIATRYPVDGIHFDYVRYAWDTEPQARNIYMRDPRTLDIYRRETGRGPDDDVAAWDAWRANQITRIVHETRLMLDRVRPQVALTGAVWRNPQLGYGSYLQNASAWLRSGLMDAIMPMAYTAKPQQFDSDIAMYRSAAPGKRVVPGIGAYLIKDAGAFRAEMASCANAGGDVAIYAYESVAPPGSAKDGPQREMRRAILGEFFGPRPRAQ